MAHAPCFPRPTLARCAALIALIVACAAAHAGPPHQGAAELGAADRGAETPLDSLFAAERAFACAAARDGMRAAFLAFLAEDGIVFRPRPVNGRRWFEERPATPGVLAWEPVHGEVAADGDLGYTTGPWTWRDAATDSAPSATGHYVSLWRRGPDRAWRVVLDAGITHGAPPDSTGAAAADCDSLPSPSRSAPPATTPRAATSALLAAERAHDAAAAETGALAALLTHAADDVRVLRSGALPACGKARLARAIDAGERQRAQPVTGAAAFSGDLGYVVGETRLAGDAGAGGGGGASTVRIWRADSTGTWWVVLDLMLPATEP